MNYEDALKIVDKILSQKVPWDGDFESYERIKKDIIHQLANELTKAWDFGYSCSEYDREVENWVSR